MKTCDKCANYKFPEAGDAKYEGACKLMRDNNATLTNRLDICLAWDYEGYGAGVYVGPKFGCIHWIEKGEQA
jgi:hypothetical protein